MKKTLTVLMAVAVLGMFTLAATAQDSILWLDVRDDSGGVQSITTPAAPFTVGQGDGTHAAAFGAPLGGAGNGQVLRLSPDCANDWEIGATAATFTPTTPFPRWPDFDGDGDLKTGALNLWMTVNGPFGTGDVISSIGIDIVNTLGTGTGTLGTLNYTWITTAFDDPSNAGKVAGAQVGDDWTGIKAVKVPVIAGPSYNVGGGLVPSATPALLGRLDVTAGPNSGTVTTIDVNMEINNLVITRTFSSGGDPNEMVSFGYDDLLAGTGLPDTAVNGGVAGPVGGNPDATIRILLKGDVNGDGATLAGDIGGLKALIFSAAPRTQEDLYVGDFNNDAAVTAGDIGGMKNAIFNTGGC